MIEATLIFLSDKTPLIVESGPNRCRSADEVSEMWCEVSAGTPCDVCGKPIAAPPPGVPS